MYMCSEDGVGVGDCAGSAQSFVGLVVGVVGGFVDVNVGDCAERVMVFLTVSLVVLEVVVGVEGGVGVLEGVVGVVMM